MVSPDGRVGVVFNGAIYNFLDLRSELAERGHVFRSETDTEVLVNGFLEWGLDAMVEKLEGMFAFALWDDRVGDLWLVRDRLGVKPLVYVEREGVLAFASTVRALRSAGYVSEVNETAIADYLRYDFIPEEESIYHGATKLPAATVARWSNGRLSQRCYWRPPPAGRPGSVSFEDAVVETERLLLAAVKKRLHADVPVGALLSGGIDSSLICWAIAELGGNVTAYTVGTPGDPLDETYAARETARRLGLRHEVLEMSEAEPPQISELVSAYAEPFSCSSALGMLRVSRAVRSSAKVLLTGDGGDDVFLGYPRHRHLFLAGRMAKAIPPRLQNLWKVIRPAVPRVGGLRRGAALLDYSSGGLDAYLSARAGLRPYVRRGLLEPRIRDAVTAAWQPPPGVPAAAALEEFLELERRTQFVAEYMTKVDGGTMYYGLEARSPFLDHRLWEFAASLPLDIRLRRFRLKAVLREIVRRRIGREVAVRRKRGFGIPVPRWIMGRWGERTRSLLAKSLLVERGFLNSVALSDLLKEQHQSLNSANLLWPLYVLESWLAFEQKAEPDSQRAVSSIASEHASIARLAGARRTT